MPSGGLISSERRSAAEDDALFRATIDELLTAVGSLSPGPDEDEIQAIRDLVDRARARFRHNPVLDHKLRNIAAVAALSSNLGTPEGAAYWIRSAIRTDSP